MSSLIAFILIAMEVCSAHPGCSPEYMINRCQVPDVTDDLLGSVHETLRGYAAVIKGDRLHMFVRRLTVIPCSCNSEKLGHRIDRGHGSRD